MQEEFVFVSSIKGKLVTRFPSLRQPTAQYIGATRKGKDIVWNTDAVVAIPKSEWNRYRREYRRVLENGSLVKRTQEDHTKWLERRKKESAKAAKKDKEQPVEQMLEQTPEQQGNQETSPAEAPATTDSAKGKPKRK